MPFAGSKPASGMREVKGDKMTTGAASALGKQGRLLSSISQLQNVQCNQKVECMGRTCSEILKLFNV